MLRLARELQSVYKLPLFGGFNVFVVADAKVARQIFRIIETKNGYWHTNL
jgi:hypothetical protein